MSNIVERLLRTEIERLTSEVARLHVLCKDRFDELDRLRADKMAISQTASDYLHELERLRADLAAERERCAQLVEEWVRPAIGDRVVPLLAAIRRGDK